MKLNSLIIGIVLAAGLLAAAACGDGLGPGGSFEAADYIVENAEVVVTVDLSRKVTDAELYQIGDALENELDHAHDYGVELADLTSIVHVDEPYYTVYHGDIDFPDLRDRLTKDEYFVEHSEGAELWRLDYGRMYFALYEEDGYFAYGRMGIVERFARANDSGEGMLSDDGDSRLRRTLDKAGSGPMVIAFAQCPNEFGLPGCTAMSIRVTGGDSDSIVGVAYLMFNSERAAESHLRDVEFILKHNSEVTVRDIATEGEFIVLKATFR